MLVQAQESRNSFTIAGPSILPQEQDPNSVPTFRLLCGEPGCCTSILLRPDQIGLERVDLETLDLHRVSTCPL